MAELRVSAPGRVCLFGEHQDYLNLPVIAAAISRRITISGRTLSQPVARIELPDCNGSDVFPVDEIPVVRSERDYLRSAVKVMLDAGYSFRQGCECTIQGTIPLNAGLSSSSALVVAWIACLHSIAGDTGSLPPEEVARLAHRAEVLEFGEPGGSMDHYASACGDVIHLAFDDQPAVTALPPLPGEFIIGDTGESKDTRAVLARSKVPVLKAAAAAAQRDPHFSLATADQSWLVDLRPHLAERDWHLLEQTLRNRDFTSAALDLLQTTPLDKTRLGELLNAQHAILRDTLGVSTPRLERFITAALSAGAAGAKLVGSGGGGCMVAWAPENGGRVLEAMSRIGTAFLVRIDRGVSDTNGDA